MHLLLGLGKATNQDSSSKYHFSQPCVTYPVPQVRILVHKLAAISLLGTVQREKFRAADLHVCYSLYSQKK